MSELHFDDHHLEEKEYAEQEGEPIVCRHPKYSEVKSRSVDQEPYPISPWCHAPVISGGAREANIKGQAQAATTCWLIRHISIVSRAPRWQLQGGLGLDSHDVLDSPE
ncbi:hypothetical protein GGR51DRAFT_543208 [Nemania sp. FL0031]|nr:hypothetical protein GGR51DRAFT_543208 [Nemania sp. FL0031]